MTKFLKKYITTAMVAAAAMIFSPVVAQETAPDNEALRQQVQTLSAKVDSLAQQLHKTDAHAAASAADTKINLNFGFTNNESTFLKAAEITGIGFAIVFIVMVIFIFVASGIDKAFPPGAEKD